MFNRILFPTDGSPAAARAMESIAELASRNPDASVTVVTVIHLRDPRESDMAETLVQTQNAHMRERANEALRDAVAIFKRRDVPVEAKTLEGDPVSAVIAAEANEGRYDLIAMGSRGMSLQKDDLGYVGSVTEHVMRRAHTPVLVIPIPPSTLNGMD